MMRPAEPIGTEPEATGTEPTETGGEHEDTRRPRRRRGAERDWVARFLAFIGIGCAFTAIAVAIARRARGDDDGGPAPPAAGA